MQDADDGRLDGLDEVDSEIVGAVEVRRALGQDWRGWLAGRVQAGGSDIGALGILAGGYRFGDRTDGLGAELFGFTTFGSTEFLNRDFGVSESESVSSGLAATELSGGYRSVGLTAIWRERFGRHLQVAVQAGVELYSGEVRSSPIAREDYEAEVWLTLLWQF